jgi:hypothetical protein
MPVVSPPSSSLNTPCTAPTGKSKLQITLNLRLFEPLQVSSVSIQIQKASEAPLPRQYRPELAARVFEQCSTAVLVDLY